MALSIASRCLFRANRSVIAATTRLYSGDVPHIDPHKGKVASTKESMPDELGHAVGAERFELLAKLAGDDPFGIERSVRKAKGTHDDPTLIPSAFGKRMVGCICEEDSLAIRWFWLHRGESKRCEGCGHWYALKDVEHKDYTNLNASQAQSHAHKH